MSDWCAMHPWMTFFIAMSLLNAPIIVIKNYRTARKDR